ncbi:hypothetical protein ACNFR7_26575 [Streptomyces sp. RM1]|uniref:hypothetical protein n=1 Tax=Streptomyces misionensis TaxID=67331 RepID=UPI003BAFD3EC
MSEHGPEIIGREILRLDALSAREGARMGKLWRRDTETRRTALVWALHAVLTGDATQSSGVAVERFLTTLKNGAGVDA